jgi:hypothetical protein
MRSLLALTAAMTALSSLALLAQERPTERPAKAYTVCEALKDREALQGQTVAIRGTTLTAGHASFLTGACQPHLVTRGFTWPDVIWLSSPPSPEAYDYRADSRVRKEISRLRPLKADQIVLTYVGIFEAKDLDKSVEVRNNGALALFGFGPDSDAPARLMVTTQMDPVVRRGKN